MLCRSRAPRLTASLIQGFSQGLIASLALLCAASATAQTAPPKPGARATDLASAAQEWLSHRYRVASTAVGIQPLDPRVPSGPCAAGWQFDQPFANESMVRARCAQPNWQVYVRANLPATAGAATAASPSPAGNPARVATPTAFTPSPTTGRSAEPAALRSVVTTTSLLPRGTRLQPSHLTLAEVPAQGLPMQVLERLEDAMGAELVRDLPAGSVLRNPDLRPAWMIRRGQTVMMSWSPIPGLEISARLEAMEDGRMGETVRLKNRESGKVVSAVVTGLNAAQGL